MERSERQEKPEENKGDEARKPKFGGKFKALLASQQEANAEANKGLEEYQRKLAETIKIHEPKPPRVDKPTTEDDEFD
jgi:hypothetical protein